MNPLDYTGRNGPARMAAAILDGTLAPSAAMGRADVYDALMMGANGTLPLLGTSAKILAAGKVDVLSVVLYMMPGNASGREACPHRTDGCTAACLAEGTGRMSMSGPQRARRRRHAAFYANRGRFMWQLFIEIARHERKARRLGKVAAIRLNGTTDFPWHRMRLPGTTDTLHTLYPDVHFYEYTKRPLSTMGTIPDNLHVTYSMNERTGSDVHAVEYLNAGQGATVVTFTKRHEPPATFTILDTTYPTVDGDDHDARFLDPDNHVVILAAKGYAKADTSGFVRTV